MIDYQHYIVACKAKTQRLRRWGKIILEQNLAGNIINGY